MAENNKNLAEKIREVETKIRQAEADLYFLQGYLQALRDQEKEAQNDNPTAES